MVALIQNGVKSGLECIIPTLASYGTARTILERVYGDERGSQHFLYRLCCFGCHYRHRRVPAFCQGGHRSKRRRNKNKERADRNVGAEIEELNADFSRSG